MIISTSSTLQNYTFSFSQRNKTKKYLNGQLLIMNTILYIIILFKNNYFNLKLEIKIMKKKHFKCISYFKIVF